MLRTLIISFLILGCFASFAQNEWGNTLRVWMEFSLGLLFLVEFFVSMKKNGFKVKGLAGFLNQWERWAFVLASAGTVLRYNSWPGAGIGYVLSGFFMVIAQLIRLGHWPFRRDLPWSARSSFLIMAAAILFAAVGFTFKVQHWPFANMLMLICLILFLVYAVFRGVLKWMGKSPFTSSLTVAQCNANGMFYMCFYSAWVFLLLWHSWSNLGVNAPKFYQTQWPNAAYEYLESNAHETNKRGYEIVEIAESELFPAIEKAEQVWYGAESSPSEKKSSQP
ncbi:MAG: hypothetical protein ACKOSR_13140 [Flavobacteriales bacterium]